MVVPAAAMALALLLSACDSAAPGTEQPAAPATEQPAEPATEVRHVRPFSGEGVRAGLRLAKRQGWCWTVSEALPTRADTWRCMHGKLIQDPCFSSQTSSFLICLRSPWERKGAKLSLTRPLPARPSLRPAIEETWAVELENGQRCLFVGGGTFTKGQLRFNYACSGGLIYGNIDKTRKLWRVFFQRKGSKTTSRLDVATAWV